MAAFGGGRLDLPGTAEAARTHLALPMGTELSDDAGRRGGRRVRVWVDLTNSPHVLVMRPLIEAMRADGHEVEVTARDFAQTLQLLERFGIEHTAIGRHRGGGLAGKARRPASTAALALARWARGRGFDVAMGHGSNDVMVAAKLLRIPRATAFDYEWAKVQHNVNCRLARAVVVPEAIPPERLDRYGARGKLRRYAGLKEEYYLADFEPDPAVLAELGLDRARADRRRAHAARRRRSTTASRTPSSRACSSACAAARRRWCCRARPRSARRSTRAGGFIVPERARSTPRA